MASRNMAWRAPVPTVAYFTGRVPRNVKTGEAPSAVTDAAPEADGIWGLSSPRYRSSRIYRTTLTNQADMFPCRLDFDHTWRGSYPKALLAFSELKPEARPEGRAAMSVCGEWRAKSSAVSQSCKFSAP